MSVKPHGRWVVSVNNIRLTPEHNDFDAVFNRAVAHKQLNPADQVTFTFDGFYEVTTFATVGVGTSPSPDPIPEPAPDPVPGPVPDPVPTPDPTPPPPADLSALQLSLLNFWQTHIGNWNFEGHTVPVPFSAGEGYWEMNETTYEPWLFDRASSAYQMYLMTGDESMRDKFYEWFDWYQSHLNENGIFIPKLLAGEADTKYSYVRPFYTYETLTGDASLRPVAQRAYNAWVSEWPTTYSRSQRFWTEREIAFALGAAVYWHKISGDPTAIARAAELVNQWDVVCDGHGAPLHTITQHGEEDSGTQWSDLMMCSPWMGCLYMQSLKAYYEVTSDIKALQQASRFADWLAQYAFFDLTKSPEYGGSFAPYYLVGEGIFYSRDGTGEDAYDHSFDVGNFFAWAAHAKTLLGEDATTATLWYDRLMESSRRFFLYWTRDGGASDFLPKYRLKPPRKGNWCINSIYFLDF